MRKLCLLLTSALMAGMIMGCSSSKTTKAAEGTVPMLDAAGGVPPPAASNGTLPPLPDAVGPHPGIQMQFNVEVPMRDGVKLRADVFTPDGPGPYPVVLTRTPYNKQGAQTSGIIGWCRDF